MQRDDVIWPFNIPQFGGIASFQTTLKQVGSGRAIGQDEPFFSQYLVDNQYFVDNGGTHLKLSPMLTSSSCGWGGGERRLPRHGVP
jgi:hypothetical protein